MTVANPVAPFRLEIPAKCLPLVQSPKRFNVLRGGRGSAKSRTIARILIWRAMQGGRRILCCREIQKSMKDSVHRLLADEIQRLGVGDAFEVLETEIRGPGGSLFLFSGLQGHTVESIKSYEGVTDVWIEEASAVSERSWEVLIPTIRTPGSKLWISFNPDLEEDPVWQRFVVNPPPPERCQVIELNYVDNPWFWQTELPAEALELKRLNPAAFAHVYMGQLRNKDGLLFKGDWFRWYDEAELPERLNYYLATDYAVTPEETGDFTELGLWGVDEKGHLWAVDWWYGQTGPGEWIRQALALCDRWRPQYWFEEKGVILRAVTASIDEAMLDSGIWVKREGIPSASNKAARALGFAARAQAGAVHLPRFHPWAKRLWNQLVAFHGQGDQVDDGVDVCSILARGLDKVARAQPAKPKRPEPPRPFTEAWFEARERGDRMERERERRDFYS